MKSINELVKSKPMYGWLIFGATMVLVFILGLFASSIIERRSEALLLNKQKFDVAQFEPRDSVWGQNNPRQYQSYLHTADTDFVSKYNGNKMIDMLERDPKLVILWAAYPFSKDYNQGRGHYYAVQDIRNTLRTGAPKDDHDGPMPNTCWTCKSPDVPRVMNEYIKKYGKDGIAKFYEGKWRSRGSEIVNAIGCGDCHDAKTMNLHISRPALIEAFQREGKDITKASYQEMRTLVCAQCHVEYYFKGEGKYLTFPWDKGESVDSIEKYYDEAQFSDWTHGLSRTPMIKAQHPEYETYKMSVHYARGVSCADCHMPYHSEGGQKFTDHRIQSPLNNMANSCQVCHRQSEEQLKKDVYERQTKIDGLRDKTEELLVRAHLEAKQAWDVGATEQEMKPVLTYIRHAQWRWDFSAASHGASFHAPLEIARILGTAIDRAQQARIELARILAKHGYTKEVPYPDISTKAKAQQYIGLDMATLQKEKAVFLQTVIPQWLETAKKREAGYPKTLNE